VAGAVALRDLGEREDGLVTSSGSVSAFAGFRFPREVISVAVRWYLCYGLSYRDVEELLVERGVHVDHVTVYRWVQRFTPEFVEAARPRRPVPGDRWFVDETYVKVAGRWTYLYRAIDQYGQVVDVWLSRRRDLTAARVFFSQALAVGTAPVEVTTDRAPAYPRILDELVPAALHVTEYANNGVEADHGPTQSPVETDARPQAIPVGPHPRHWACLRPEPTTGPLRDRRRPARSRTSCATFDELMLAL
jgi:transposase-like protein